jgi:hypothetical protein
MKKLSNNLFEISTDQSKVLGEGVVELFHGDLAISVAIKSSQHSVLFMLGTEDIE